MTINPDLLTVSSDEQQAMRVLSSIILFMLRFSMRGIIQSFDPMKRLCNVQLAISGQVAGCKVGSVGVEAGAEPRHSFGEALIELWC